MSITYEQIIRDLSDFKLSPVKVIKIVKKGNLIERETQCVRCYAPSLCKDEYVDFVKTLFQGRGLTIYYMPNNEMIEIKIPEIKVDTSLETWKDIIGFEGFYQISNIGRIKSCERTCSGKLNSIRTVKEKILKTHKDRKGYLSVMLQKDKRKSRITCRVHRLVAQSFIPNPKNLPQVNHIDGNKSNNCVENLEWCNNSQNSQHAYLIGLKKGRTGESHPGAKLKEVDIIRIRELYKNGIKPSDISKEYPQVIYNHILAICKNNSWKNIAEPKADSLFEKMKVFKPHQANTLHPLFQNIINNTLLS